MRVAAIVRHRLRILCRDPAPLVVLVGLPLILIPFIMPIARDALTLRGYHNVTGAEHVVPGMALMFSFFVVNFLGYYVFQEHGWGTWVRLRASRASTLEIVIGEITPVYFLSLLQFVVVFGIGILGYGLRIRGSVAGVILTWMALALALCAVGMALVAVCSSIQQLYAVGSLSAMVMGGLSGALAPTAELPGWLALVAPLTPGYWAMLSFQRLILDGEGMVAIGPSVAALLVIALVGLAVAVARFRVDESKGFWS